MLLKRIIPVLLLKDDELYKTTKFKSPIYIGDPINAVKIFNEKEVDELIILDIDASIKKKEPNYKLLEEIASESFIPMCYGGGVKNIESFKRLIQLGYERIILNSSAFENPSFVQQCVEKFGSSSVIIGIDYKLINKNDSVVFINSGSSSTKYSVLNYAIKMGNLGAGEIFLNSIDRDGTYIGYDESTIKEVISNVNIPVTVCGGAGNISHLEQILKLDISGVAAGSIFVFYGALKAVLINYPSKDKLSFLNGIK